MLGCVLQGWRWLWGGLQAFVLVLDELRNGTGVVDGTRTGGGGGGGGGKTDEEVDGFFSVDGAEPKTLSSELYELRYVSAERFTSDGVRMGCRAHFRVGSSGFWLIIRRVGFSRLESARD